MDREKLAELEIEETELEAIEDALEEKQNDLETRMDAAESNGNMERKKQLEAELMDVQELLKQVKEEREAAKTGKDATPKEEEKKKTHGIIPTSVEETPSHTVPTSMDEMEVLKDSVADKWKAVTKGFGLINGKKTEEKDEKADKKAKEAEEKKHEAELKAKAAKLRKKAAEEKASEEKATTDDVKDFEKDKEIKVSDATLSEFEKDFNDGVADYAYGKYSSAFSKIFKVANAGIKSGLSKDQIGQAEQILARMYKNGHGTKVDESRAWFWFEKAAEHENIEGCLAMGQRNTELKPKSPKEEKEFREKALDYFKIAGKAGNKVGKEKFVDICLKKKDQVSNADIRMACKFLDELIALEPDTFLKQSLSDQKEELRKRTPKKEKNRTNGSDDSILFRVLTDMIAIIGTAITAFGVMLLCYYTLFYLKTPINFDWITPEYFINNEPSFSTTLGIDIYEGLWPPRGGGNRNPALWSMIFIPIGTFLSGLGSVEKRGKIANFICEFVLYLSAGLGFIACYYHEGVRHLLDWTVYLLSDVCYIIPIMVGAYLCGRVPSLIIKGIKSFT